MRWATEVAHPRRITVAILVHVPRLEGYWAESLEVLESCLDSLAQSTAEPFDLLVFDNASCPEVRHRLAERSEQGAIQLLMLSDRNLGKTGAWNLMFRAAPGEIVAYADGDVFFDRGWLERSLEVLAAFPEAGMITAQPARRGLRFCRSTLEQAGSDPGVEVRRGDLLPPAFLDACAHGLGRTREEHAASTAGQDDVRLRRGDAWAFVSADHFQFLTTREALAAVLPFDVTRPLHPDDDTQLDRGIDEAGLWRLSLPEFLVHHLGNHAADPDALRRLAGGAAGAGAATRARARRRPSRVLESRPVRRLLKRLNTLSYRLLYPEER